MNGINCESTLAPINILHSSISAGNIAEENVAEENNTGSQVSNDMLVNNVEAVTSSSESIRFTLNSDSLLPLWLSTRDAEHDDLAERDQMLAGIGELPQVAALEADATSDLSGASSRKSWLLQYLAIITGTALIATLGGVIGACVYSRVQRSTRCDELSLPSSPATAYAPARMPVYERQVQPLLSPYKKHNFGTMVKGEEGILISGRNRRSHSDTVRVDPRKPAQQFAEEKDNKLRFDYLNRLACSNEKRAERNILLQTAHTLPPDMGTRYTDTINTAEGAKLVVEFVVFKTPKRTVSGWWIFKTETVTQAVVLRPLFECNCTDVELLP